ncbi:NAD(P)H-dependent oxidoreductase [Daejeonella oryzae]|uniref:NAD(P)H-dependent oxidoreductase n=1 Tax=Daejeonella oryzae TaxID=1122943 RepID=UPI00041A4806|nr:NAD(P)H-dependent oxidoreductase [Daejeonella oryzae]
MPSILILFAHPAFEKSRTHKELIRKISGLENVTINDLYEEYPDFDINVEREKELLLKHDILIFQHPFYWYSMPALLKQWMDLVLEYGFAYGIKGTHLRNKKIFNAISTGGSFSAYQKEGHNRYTITEFLAVFDQTAFLCKMTYYPPFVVHNSHLLSSEEIEDFSNQYLEVVTGLRDGIFSEDDLVRANYMNNLIGRPYTL